RGREEARNAPGGGGGLANTVQPETQETEAGGWLDANRSARDSGEQPQRHPLRRPLPIIPISANAS
ncbi:MAG: hypothetical protein WBJ51_01835, partial [Methanoculleus sp.]